MSYLNVNRSQHRRCILKALSSEGWTTFEKKTLNGIESCTFSIFWNTLVLPTSENNINHFDNSNR